jgi:hypothetical protein
MIPHDSISLIAMVDFRGGELAGLAQGKKTYNEHLGCAETKKALIHRFFRKGRHLS